MLIKHQRSYLVLQGQWEWKSFNAFNKKQKKQIEGIDFNKSYPVIEAVKLLKEKKFVKFR